MPLMRVSLCNDLLLPVITNKDSPEDISSSFYCAGWYNDEWIDNKKNSVRHKNVLERGCRVSNEI